MVRPVGTSEIAKKLGCSRETVRRMAANGTIPALKLPGAWKLDPEQVIIALSHGNQPTPEKQ